MEFKFKITGAYNIETNNKQPNMGVNFKTAR